MAVSLEEMRAYVNDDEDTPESDIAVLESCLQAAIEYFTNAGVSPAHRAACMI